MKKILMVSTIASTIAQFNMNNINILNDMGYQVDVACDYTNKEFWPPKKIEEFEEEIKHLGGKIYQVDFSRKLSKFYAHIKSLRQMIILLKTEKYEFIHTHTPIASVISRIAAHKTNTKVIYTAHGFHFYDGAPIQNWLIYYPIEKFLSRWTDILITINKEDYKRAKRHLYSSIVYYIPGVGIDIEKYKNVEVNREKKREELGIKNDDIMILSVGELNANKNHRVVIDALAKLHNSHIHYCIAGEGVFRNILKKKASKLNERVQLLGYRIDIVQLMQSADIFVFPSKREGLGLAAIEAMATGLPLVVADNRGSRDYAENEVNAIVVNSSDIDGFKNAINRLCNNESLRRRMGAINQFRAVKFDVRKVNKTMRKIYSKI